MDLWEKPLADTVLCKLWRGRDTGAALLQDVTSAPIKGKGGKGREGRGRGGGEGLPPSD